MPVIASSRPLPRIGVRDMLSQGWSMRIGDYSKGIIPQFTPRIGESASYHGNGHIVFHREVQDCDKRRRAMGLCASWPIAHSPNSGNPAR